MVTFLFYAFMTLVCIAVFDFIFDIFGAMAKRKRDEERDAKRPLKK